MQTYPLTLKHNLPIFRILLTLAVLCFFSPRIFAQTDHEFWFAAPAVTHQTVHPSAFTYTDMNKPVIISVTTAEGPAIVKVEQPANPLFTPIIKVVNNDSAREFNLTPFISSIENTPANTVLNQGLKITSNKRINAIYEIQSVVNSATYTLSGRNALGYEFIIPAQNHLPNYPYCDPPARNSFDIVATEDFTTVKIVPTKDIVGHPAEDTVVISLNYGQTWSGRAASADSTGHLGGSFVFANKPIAVTVTDDAIYYPNTSETSFDIAGDQLFPRNICGTEFITNNDLASGMPTRYSIYAFEDNTTIVFHDTIAAYSKTINRGEVAEFSLGFPASIPISMGYGAYIESNKPVLVYELSGISGLLSSLQSNQASACIVPPISCAGSRRICFTRTAPTGAGAFFNFVIVTKNGNQTHFQMQPNYINLFNFQPVPGTNGQYVYLITSEWGPNMLNQTIHLLNTAGRFQLSALSSSTPSSTYGYHKLCYLTDYSQLNLGPDKKICPGDSTLLDAGFGLNSFLWNTGDTTHSIWVKAPGTYWVHSVEPDCHLDDTIVVSYHNQTPVNLGPDKQLCINDSVQLDAGSGRIWYHWNTGASSQTIWVKNSGTYWVDVSDEQCVASDTVRIMVSPAPSIINTTMMTNICTGESPGIFLLSDIPVTNFHWTAVLTSGTVTGFSADSGFVINQVLVNPGTQPGIVKYHVTPRLGSCEGTARDFIVTVNPGALVDVTISTSLNNTCTGTQVTYTATPVNPGNAPTFHWLVNGINAGTNSPEFTYTPNNGDMVKCVLNSSILVCTSNNPDTSNFISMTVNPLMPVNIGVSASTTSICGSVPVTFTANPQNGGPAPAYQWKVNGINSGTNNPVFNYTPANGDQVTCELTSDILCPSGNPAGSIPVIMTVNPILPVSVTVSHSPDPVCSGNPSTFTATPINGGIDPSFSWNLNGVLVGTDSPVYTYSPGSGDMITCGLLSSIPCPLTNPVISLPVQIIVWPAPQVLFTPCFDTVTAFNARPFHLKGGLPLGGTYTGPGIANNIFNPSVAGTGVKAISYSYTNSGQCSAAKTKNIAVRATDAFICGDNLKDIRDNRIYPTTQIGSQCWMAANLSYGIEIPLSQIQFDNCIPEKYCYNDDPENCKGFGGLYHWDELMKYEDAPPLQGLCPPGWHIPAESEWTILFTFYTSNAFAGYPLQHQDFSGFNSLLSGVQHLNSSENYKGFATFFWSSAPEGRTKARAHAMNSYDPSISSYSSARTNAFSVRCVKD